MLKYQCKTIINVCKSIAETLQEELVESTKKNFRTVWLLWALNGKLHMPFPQLMDSISYWNVLIMERNPWNSILILKFLLHSSSCFGWCKVSVYLGINWCIRLYTSLRNSSQQISGDVFPRETLFPTKLVLQIMWTYHR